MARLACGLLVGVRKRAGEMARRGVGVAVNDADLARHDRLRSKPRALARVDVGRARLVV